PGHAPAARFPPPRREPGLGTVPAPPAGTLERPPGHPPAGRPVLAQRLHRRAGAGAGLTGRSVRATRPPAGCPPGLNRAVCRPPWRSGPFFVMLLCYAQADATAVHVQHAADPPAVPRLLPRQGPRDRALGPPGAGQ